MGDLKKYSHPDYDHLLIEGSGLKRELFITCNILEADELPGLENIKGVFISGSSLMLTDDHSWKGSVYQWLEEVAALKIPILGICFGHQILAEVFGGAIGNNPTGFEIGTTEITVNETGKTDAVFSKMYPAFDAHVSHLQSVLKLPEKSVILAYSKMDQIQAFRINNNIWGVQFHPEFDLKLMKKIVASKAKNKSFNINSELILKGLVNTDKSYSILRKFGKLIESDLDI